MASHVLLHALPDERAADRPDVEYIHNTPFSEVWVISQ